MLETAVGIEDLYRRRQEQMGKPLITERMQMTSQKPCLCTRQNSEMVMVAIYLGNIVTNPRGVLYTLVSLRMQRF